MIEINQLMPVPVVLSHFQAVELVQARQAGQDSVRSSSDLGLTQEDVRITADFAIFANGALVRWEDAETICSKEAACFMVDADGIQELRRYSAATRHTYALMATGDAPALTISGFSMHRIKAITPWRAAQAMVAALGSCRGAVLDTTMGLGYTSMVAAKTAKSVVAIEIDPQVVELAQLNPWSRQLFSDTKITRRCGDSCDEIAALPAAAFTAVIHDPPSISLAGDLYSGAFYAQVYRVLQPGGRLFHYIGDPASSLGGRVTGGVKKRLSEAGFSRVIPKPRAFGVLAIKE